MRAALRFSYISSWQRLRQPEHPLMSEVDPQRVTRPTESVFRHNLPLNSTRTWPKTIERREPETAIRSHRAGAGPRHRHRYKSRRSRAAAPARMPRVANRAPGHSNPQSRSHRSVARQIVRHRRSSGARRRFPSRLTGPAGDPLPAIVPVGQAVENKVIRSAHRSPARPAPAEISFPRLARSSPSEF